MLSHSHKNYTTNKIISKIFAVTEKIQNECPELYALLSETPLFLTLSDTEINEKDFVRYLESIEIQWATFSKMNTTSSDNPK